MNKKLSLLTLLLTCGSILPIDAAYAQDSEKVLTTDTPAQVVMDRVMVIGSKEGVFDVTGSAHFIGEEELDDFKYTDINRVLRQVPGVNIQEEEGYGNRPNIGIRGGRSERSADITLMEDGVLIAPAPYAAASAYYFPRVNRMEAVEVRKGSSTIKFGPRTTSGAVNLISSSVPENEEAEFMATYGMYNTKRLQGHYGNSYKSDSFGNVGFVIDASHDQTDGFKDIDIVGGDTGYSIQDVMGKLRFSTDTTADIYQSLEFKIGATEEDSDETYLGISDDDFNSDPYRRYTASQEDNMDALHKNYHIRHFADFGSFDATTTLYHNKFSRNWYKLDDITIGGTRQSLGAALDDATYLSALKGTTDLDGSAANNLTLRNNNRDYYSTGIQTDIATTLYGEDTTHNIEGGVRYHYDKEDRFQSEDRYAITSGVMALTNQGAPGSNADRHSTAKAGSAYVLDEIEFGDWTFVPGIRYEYVDTRREDYNSGDIRSNSVDAFLPGLGIGYNVNDDINVFGGIHKGFAPPSSSSTNDQPEESINYEIGTRYSGEQGLDLEFVGFFNDYSNLLGECTASSGCSTALIGEQFNAGEVETYGVEASASYDVSDNLGFKDVRIPISFNYTYTHAEFQTDFVSSFDEWGTVQAGDELPYIPEHQFYVQASVVDPKWEMNVGAKFVDEMRTQAGQGSIPNGQGTDAHFVVDMAGEYEVDEGARLFLTADNIFNTEYVAARRPAGARPGRPFTVMAGVKFEF